MIYELAIGIEYAIRLCFLDSFSPILTWCSYKGNIMILCSRQLVYLFGENFMSTFGLKILLLDAWRFSKDFLADRVLFFYFSTNNFVNMRTLFIWRNSFTTKSWGPHFGFGVSFLFHPSRCPKIRPVNALLERARMFKLNLRNDNRNYDILMKIC